jgi:bifunctional non-homologous end joining protein LigD
MLATAGIPPNLDGWVAEPKLDGWRARLLVDDDGLAVRTRSGRDVSASLPQLAPLATSGLRAALDGELVADSGRLSDFYLVGPTLAMKRTRSRRVTFVAFDLLWLDDQPLTTRPHAERRALLEGLGLPALGVPVMPTYGWDDAPALFRACEATGVERIVLKQLSAPYLPGRRTTAWRKAKCSAWREHRERRLPG